MYLIQYIYSGFNRRFETKKEKRWQFLTDGSFGEDCLFGFFRASKRAAKINKFLESD